MGVRELLKDAGRAIASIADLGGTARAAAYRQTQEQPAVPAETRAGMDAAGMTTGSLFTPGEPLTPFRPVGTPPVLTAFPVGANLYMLPRSSTGVDFSTLRSLSQVWDLARLCIEVREDEIRSLDWDIVPIDEDGEDGQTYESEIKAARRFFEHPDGIWDFSSFVSKCAEDWLRYDALTIYRHRTRGGKLGALECIDGTTVGPLIDDRGAQPRWPAPSYTQWAWGMPYTWMTDRDVIYQPHRPRPESRYGLPPLEWTQLLSNTDVRLQWYFLSYFTSGEVPEVFINAPPDVQDPKQVRALQDAYSAVMSGAAAAHHKVKWIPPGASVHLSGKGKFDTAFSDLLNATGCAAFKVQPQDVGLPMIVYKSTGQVQSDVQYRRSVKPTVQYFQGIWDRIIHHDLGMPYARFKYLGIEEEEDQLVLAQTRQIYIQNAVLSADEVRAELGYDVDPDAPVGRMVVGRTALFFVDPKSQHAARAAGNLAQQAGIDPTATQPDPDDGDEDQAADDPDLMTPAQVIVDPGVKPKPTGGAPPPATPGAPAATPPAKAARDDLRKWRDLAVNRAKAGKAQRPFVSDAIPSTVAQDVAAGLAKAAGPADVRAVFTRLLGDGDPKAP